MSIKLVHNTYQFGETIFNNSFLTWTPRIVLLFFLRMTRYLQQPIPLDIL